MGRFWRRGTPRNDVDIRQSARARRMTLRVSSLDGKVTLTVPRGTAQSACARFLDGHADWIDNARAKVAAPVPVALGAAVPVEGVTRTIVQGAGRCVHIGPSEISVPASRPVGPSVQGALKTLARDRIASRLDVHAGTLGRKVTRLTLRDTRGRWGSCSEAGAVMLSWRLILAPPDVLDYVVAHEAAHLVEMNHSPAFWSVVARLCPDADRHRTWLRAQGPALHRYRFD